MKLFCKHDYEMTIVEKQSEPEIINSTTKIFKNKVGCMIVCSKCGKRKKKVEKLVTELIVKERVKRYKRSFENEYQRFYHQG